jgi:hypothetical protein
VCGKNKGLGGQKVPVGKSRRRIVCHTAVSDKTRFVMERKLIFEFKGKQINLYN